MMQGLGTKRQEGFTLIELMIVIAIIGILAAIAIPNFISYRKRSYDAVAQSDLKNLMTAQEAYYMDNQTYKDGIAITASDAPQTIDMGSAGSVTVSKGVSITSTADADGYTMTASHASGATTWTVQGPGGAIVEQLVEEQ